jgi:hypothetical protein
VYKRCYPNADNFVPSGLDQTTRPWSKHHQRTRFPPPPSGFACGRSVHLGRPHSPEWPMVTAAYALGLMDMRDPVDVEIFADEIDANVAARAFNWAYLSGARSAVVERDPRGWVVRVYQYAPVGYLAPKTEAAV